MAFNRNRSSALGHQRELTTRHQAACSVTATLRSDGSVGCGAAIWSPDTHQYGFIILPTLQWEGALGKSLVESLAYNVIHLEHDPEFMSRYPH